MVQNSSTLMLSLTQEKVNTPYYFHMTGIKVYSIEELYYHCYHYWKQSLDDFIMGNIEGWIEKELGLFYISSQMKKIKENEKSITNQYISFLNIIEYFYDEELKKLRQEIFRWENKDEWEKCKEKGDILLGKDKAEQAIYWYERALQLIDDGKLLNNLGVAYMQLGNYEKALQCLMDAHKKLGNTSQILLNLSHIYVLLGKYAEGKRYIDMASKIRSTKEVWLQYGELWSKWGYENEALNAYEKAISLGDPFTAYIQLADIYRKKKRYEKALDILEKVSDTKKTDYYMEVAQIYEDMNKVSQAILYLKEAIQENPKHIPSLIALSRLYRKSDQMILAKEVLNKAKEQAPSHEAVELEWARIQKHEGKPKDYQSTLKNILHGWIKGYHQKQVKSE